MIKVLIADDSALIRQEIKHMVNAIPNCEVVGCVRDGQAAVEQSKLLDVDVVFLDINMPLKDGLTALDEIMKNSPRICIILSSYAEQDSDNYTKAIQLKAAGVIQKPSRVLSRDLAAMKKLFIDNVNHILNSPKTRRFRSKQRKAEPVKSVTSTPAALPPTNERPTCTTKTAPSTQLPPDTLAALVDFIHQQTGLSFHKAKADILASRVLERMANHGKNSADDYFHTIVYDSTEFRTLVHQLTNNGTSFFRDPEQLRAFSSKYLPLMIQRKRLKNDRRLSLWSAGCSSGEEPYSLSLILHEAIPDINEWSITIDATDINDKVLSQARTGLFVDTHVREVPAYLLCRYFTPKNEGHLGYKYQVGNDIKKPITFKTLNLLDCETDLVGKCYDFIFCRNVFLHFDNQSIQRSLTNFHQVLDKDGFLCLGRHEMPDSAAARGEWEPSSAALSIFNKRF